MSVIGLRIGPFRIVRRAWVPGPGRWFVARGDGDPPEVLVRVVSQDGGGDEPRAVQQQSDVLRELADPRIPAPVGQYGVVPGSPSVAALALRAATGAPLSDAIAMRGDESVVMTPGTLLDLVLEVAEALEHAHGRGRVHGHLDPDHVVLAPNGGVWVYGFGAGLEEDPQAGWTSPEQARGGPATVETDQWALGAMALGLVLGHPVWRDQDPVGEAARGDASALVDAVGQQWPALGRVLGRMTDPRPQERYPSMTEAREDLAELGRIAGGTSDRAVLADLLCGRRGEADAPEEYDVVMAPPPPMPVLEGGAPTAVPLTDAEERLDPDPLPPRPVARHGRDIAEPNELEEPSIGSDRAAPPRAVARDLSIVTLAPILAGVMVVLLIVWLIVNGM